MGDSFDKQKGHAPVPGRVAAPAQDAPTVGKVTRVQQCYEHAPQLLAQFRDRPHSYLDDLLPPHDPEEVKRLIARAEIEKDW